MAKVSKRTIQIPVDGSNRNFDVECMYTSDRGFYSKTPQAFEEIFESLSKEQVDKFGIRNLKISGRMVRVFQSSVESDVYKYAHSFLTYAIQSKIDRREVIIVFYSKSETQYGAMEFSKPLLGMEFSYTECQETTVFGQEPSYAIKKNYGFEDEGKFTYKKISLYRHGKNLCIIPNTPENLVMINQLYEAMDKLKNKLNEITSSSDNFLEMIQSGIKFIN